MPHPGDRNINLLAELQKCIPLELTGNTDSSCFMQPFLFLMRKHAVAARRTQYFWINQITSTTGTVYSDVTQTQTLLGIK